MADTISGKKAGASLVFHDGTSMIVINEGKPFGPIDNKFRQKLIDGNVIKGAAKPAADVQPVKADGGMQTGGDVSDSGDDDDAANTEGADDAANAGDKAP